MGESEGSAPTRGPTATRASLRVVSGPNPGQEYPIRDTYTKIGRDPEFCRIVITERTVSRLHAEIEEKQDGSYYIRDQGGINLVRVDGELLSVAEERILHNGAMIQLGAVKLEFVLSGGEDKDKTVSLTDDTATKTDVFTDSQPSAPSDETRPILAPKPAA